MKFLLCTLFLAGANAAEWFVYPGSDSEGSHDYTVNMADAKGAVTKESFRTNRPLGTCKSNCFADANCHGFVVYGQFCYFRGGLKQGPDVLFKDRVPRADMTLYIMYGPHPNDPIFMISCGAFLLLVVALIVVGVAYPAVYPSLLKQFQASSCGQALAAGYASAVACCMDAFTKVVKFLKDMCAAVGTFFKPCTDATKRACAAVADALDSCVAWTKQRLGFDPGEAWLAGKSSSNGSTNPFLEFFFGGCMGRPKKARSSEQLV